MCVFAVHVNSFVRVTMAAEDLEQQICKQLDFYFGDANLTKDRFLRQHLENAEDLSMRGGIAELVRTSKAYSFRHGCRHTSRCYCQF